MSAAVVSGTDVFRLPDVGEGLTEAEIVGWRVQVGQTVAVNDVLVEIETAKSLVELPSPVDGVVAELLVAEGDTVEVHAPIIRFGAGEPAADPAPAGSPPAGWSATAPVGDAPAGDAPAGDAPAGGAPAGQSPTAAAQQAAPGEPTAAAAEAAEVGIERTGPPAPAPATAPAEEPLHAVPDAGAGTRSANLVGYGARQDAATSRRRRLSVAARRDEPGPRTDVPVLAKPPVRKLARELGVELSAIRPSGPGGTVTREDVAGAARRLDTGSGAGRAAPVQAADEAEPLDDSGSDPRETRVQVRSVRRMTAEAVTASAFSAPHVTEFLDVDVTRSYRLLDRLRARKDFAGLKVSPVLLVAKAMCLAAGRTPEINASWDGPNNEIVYKRYVNLGIAAATPRGLLVPNVKDADQMPLPQLCREINDLVATARAGQTTPDQMRGGTITLTNVGVFGVDTGTPILNAGESAILAVGAITDRPWVHKGKVRPRKVTTLALSFDHRIVDGEQGSRFLADVGVILSDPATSLLWT